MSAVHFLLLNFKVYQLVVFMAHQMACTVLLTNKTDNIHQIDRYNVYDQCMARPESSRAYHNRLAFHMDKQQFCPADGLLICFVGQLGPELALPNGQVAEPFYQIANKKPNPVTKRCDHLRKKLERANGCGKEEGKCEWKAPISNASTGTWHGILLKTTDSDEHVLVQLSSSQQNYTFERSKLGDGEDDGWFFLKLVSAVNGGQSFFSREQGPELDFYSLDDGFASSRENSGRIDVGDQQLFDAFKKNVPNGASLKNYVGVWSLGLEMLPLSGSNTFWLFAMQSECCDLMAWYLRQTDNLPADTDELQKHKNVKFPSLNQMRFSEGMTPKLGGQREKDAKVIEIALEDTFVRENGIVKLKIVIGVDSEDSRFEQTLKNVAAPKIDKLPSFHFKEKGHFFILKATFSRQALTIDFNCQGPVEIRLEKEFSYNGLYNFTYKGTVGKPVTIMPPGWTPDAVKEVNLKVWSYENVGVGKGILFRGIRGKIGNGDFGISLLDKAQKPILEVNSDIENLQYVVKMPKVEEGGNVKLDDGTNTTDVNLRAGVSFEIFIRIRGKRHFDIWADGKVLQTIPNSSDEPVDVHFIQISGNWQLNDPKPIITPEIPQTYKLDYKNVSAKRHFKIDGKFLVPRDDSYSKLFGSVMVSEKGAVPVFELKKIDYNIQITSFKDSVNVTKVEPGEAFTIVFYYKDTAEENEKPKHEFKLQFNKAEMSGFNGQFPTKIEIGGDIYIINAGFV